MEPGYFWAGREVLIFGKWGIRMFAVPVFDHFFFGCLWQGPELVGFRECGHAEAPQTLSTRLVETCPAVGRIFKQFPYDSMHQTSS